MDISVVIATYNGEKYLEQQLDSILSQTLPPAELIICDDCSIDRTLTILEKYRKRGLLTYVRNDRQLGLIDNFKKAVSLAAETNYVALSDQDDQWLPDKLQRSAELLDQMDQKLPAMVYTDLLLVDQDEHILNTSFRNERGQDHYQHNLQTLFFSNFVNGCTVLMNSKLRFFFANMPNHIKLNHDGWLALAAFTFGEPKSINSALVRYRKHENNVSTTLGTVPKNRYLNTINQLVNAWTGHDDFLSVELETTRYFYMKYKDEMSPDKRKYFEDFLKLESKSFLFKKLAYGKIVRKYKI